MPLSTTEKTDAQRKWFSRIPGYGLRVNAGLWGGLISTSTKATEESGLAEGKAKYTPLTWAGGCGIDAYGPLASGTVETYRAMMAHPTIALARAAVLLSILAAEWYAEIDDDLAEDATAELGKAVIEQELIRHRAQLLRDTLRCLDYGWQAFELIYGRKKTPDGKDITGVAKFKTLLPERVQLQIDDHGNLTGVDCGKAKLRSESFLHVVYDREGDDHHGRSRMENCRRSWANWLNLQDRMMELVRLGTGIIPKVLVPPDSAENTGATPPLTPNLDAGVNIVNRLADGQGVTSYNLLGLDPRAIENQPDLAGKSTLMIDRIDMGNPGPTIAAIGGEIDRLDKLLVRGWLQPERTLTEATTAGSRADSESHGDLSLADAEATHELIVGQLNDQVVKYLITENCGEKYVGRIRLVAAPIQDEQKRQLSATWAALLTDPQFRATLVYSLQTEGVQGIVDKLGLSLKLAEPFDMLPEPPATDPNAPPDEPQDDDKPKQLSLSASDDEGYWFTTKTGHHIHAADGESKGDALKKEFGASAKKVLGKYVEQNNGGDNIYGESHASLQDYASGKGGKSSGEWEHLHDQTQSQLKSAGTKSMTLYRGLALHKDHPIAKALAAGTLKPGDEVDLDTPSAQSYSEHKSEAKRFAEVAPDKSNEHLGVIVQHEADAENIITGERFHKEFLDGEGEVIAKTPGKKARVRIVSVHDDHGLTKQ